MDTTGKLIPGIVGIVVCLILLMAVALPIIGSMVSTIEDEESVPAQVTARGTNGASLDDAYALLEPSSDTYTWLVNGIEGTSDVGLTFTKNGHQYERFTNPEGFRLLIAGDHPNLIWLDDNVLYFYSGVMVRYFTLPATADGSYVEVTYHKVSGDPQVEIFAAIQGTSVEIFTFAGVDYVFAKAYLGTNTSTPGWQCYQPTHGLMSGDPDAYLGSGAAFHIVGADERALAIDMTPALGLGQRVFLLDDGRVLDLDDREAPVKELAAYREAKGAAEIPGPVLETSRAQTALAVAFSSEGSTSVLANTDAGYTGTWTDVAFQDGLMVPFLDSVQSGGSDVSGWYVPLDWEYTGEGVVDRQPMVKAVLSVLPVILVVALLVLVVRWMQEDAGRPETDSFLGRGRARRPYDGWRDRR